MAAPDASARMHHSTAETEGAVDLVLDHARRRILEEHPPLNRSRTPGELSRLAAGTLTEDGIGAREALSVFERILAPACVTLAHPRHLSFIPGAPTKAATAFDLAVSAANAYGGSWLESSGAIFAENEVLAFLAREFGLPAEAGGAFVQGGTLGNLSALVAARDAALRKRNGHRPPRWRVVCSAEAHSSLVTAAKVMDIDITLAPTGADGKLTGQAVERALERYGDEVFAVVATAGSTNFGIVDDIASLTRLRPSHDFWLHVDGAYGLAAMLTPERRELFRGVELADSLTVDPHKWLFAPFDACALLYRDPGAARAAHAQDAAYLDPLHDAPGWNPADYAVHLSRRTRGLPLWFSLATHGAGAYRAAIARCLHLAQEIAEEIRARPRLSLVRDPELSVVVFRREGWRKADYTAWSDRLLREQTALVVPSSHQGEPVTRFALVNPAATREELIEVLDTMER
ncbi:MULTISPECIES: pyridoxal phosphate-dependent decarboxylase family protein [Streptomyces]|uniref:pyridoxal phosphate-dependent decarboxylase family protein n=1 Tax=Streptomyces TaxID=1883 RepID=UPI0004C6FA62|nr:MULTISPECIES: aminotransferase class V-fold PLP-dependent enzyme [Streptomyces]KPC95515.1 glutamate decarboxylase [Streptomyces sp. NRRL F-6602]GHJ21360.1 glutamate decarboxylase [Streptomyces albus]